MAHRPIKTYSRIKSRALTTNQKRLMDSFLPKVNVLKNLELYIAKFSNHIVGRRLNEGQAVAQHSFERISLEIGFGSGENLLHQAINNPNTLYIGAEPYLNGVVKVLAKMEESAINNILIHASDARELFPLFRKYGVILDEIFILFPDPWPKVRQHKKRLINNTFLEMLIELMEEESKLYIATDHVGYMEWIKNSLDDLYEKFEHRYNNTPFYDSITSKYQKKGVSCGRKLHYFCAYIKKYDSLT